LIWSGSVVRPPGGVHYFADEFFEDVFEGDHGLGMAVVVDKEAVRSSGGGDRCLASRRDSFR